MSAGPTRIRLATPEDTDALGRALGAVVRAGDLVLLDGGLGAGKTTLTKGIAAGMGVTGRVLSPTFVLARVHPPAAVGSGPPLVHVDAYRLHGALELDDLDLDTDLATAAVVVEWGPGVADQLSPDRLVVSLERGFDDVRTAELRAVGGDWSARVAAVLDALPPADSTLVARGAGDALFSYGTLQDPAVQRASFGRLLDGRPDRLPGHRVDVVLIADPDVVAVSGSDRHPIVRATGDPRDAVEGTVFDLSPAELAAADAYEVDDYRRVLARLASGRQAWVYLARDADAS